MKFYEFRYRSKGAKIFGGILNVISCFFYPVITVLLFLFVLNFFGITDHWYLWMYFVLILISVIIGLVFVIRYFTNLKGIIICDEYLEIERHCITDFQPKSKIKIYYKDIKSVYSSRQQIPRSSWKAKKQLVSGGDLSYYVEVLLQGGKEYFFPVENQEEFVRDLLEQINKFRLSQGFDEI